MSLGKVFGKILRPRVTILFTIFDTNIYRGISAQRLQQMRLLEQQQGVVALSAYWPALELLAGFNSGDAARAARCEKAIARLVDHAAYPHQGSLRIRVMADGEVQLAGGLFQQELEQRLLNHAGVSELILAIGRNGQRDLNDSQRQALERATEYVESRERRFAAMMDRMADTVREAAHQGGYLEQEARRDMVEFIDSERMPAFIAQARVLSLAKTLNLEPSAFDSEDLSQKVLRAFPVAIVLMQQLIRKSIVGGVNWQRSDRANSVWDRDIAFHASRAATIEGVPVLLVTDDSAILDAAGAVSYEPFVETLAGYVALLESGAVAKREEAMLAVEGG